MRAAANSLHRKPGADRSHPLYGLTMLIALCAAVGLTACDPPSGDRDLARMGDATTAVGSDEPGSSPQVEREIAQLGSAHNAAADAAISASVQNQLALDAELRDAGIGVDTFQGRVALRGTAPNATARERASQIAAGIDGVRSIDNRIEVPTA